MRGDNISGRLGEDYAANHLEQNGYKIICRNYRTRCCEIDIVASNGDIICFIEVKTRKTKKFGFAYEAVDFHKRQKMILGARSYILSEKIENDIRFDVVEVYGELVDSGFSVSEINIIKNAFDV